MHRLVVPTLAWLSDGGAFAQRASRVGRNHWFGKSLLQAWAALRILSTTF
jgi:hypothetical protein